jgi:predicted metal-dependent phosphoesterase TrpH
MAAGDGGDTDRVTFARPDVDSILAEGLMCADMHFHTNASDSYTTVKDALALATKRKVGLTISDHNLISGIVKAFETNTPDGPFLVPGIEISAWDGPHILVYFYTLDELKEYWTNNVKPNISNSPWLAIDKGTEWILDSLEDANCVVSAAHPLGYLSTVKGVQKAIDKGILDREVATRFDAYEVICSGMFRNENVSAWNHTKEYGIGFTGGSDGHLLSELGTVLTVSDATDLDSFLDNIVKHRNTVVGHEKNIPKKMVMGMTSVSRFMGSYLLQSISRKMELARYSGTKNRPEGKI